MISGSSPSLKLLIVTKGRSAVQIVEFLRNHPTLFRIGENRVEEAELKFTDLKALLGADFDGLEKHFIGKIQSRKIKDIVRLFDVVESLESLEQAEKLNQHAAALGKTLRVFIEVNLTGLPQRSGAKIEEVSALVHAFSQFSHLQLEGVMGMASLDAKSARDEFRLLKSLQGDLKECSMGMSQDYPIAILEGSTLVRLGTVLFEEGLPKGYKFE